MHQVSFVKFSKSWEMESPHQYDRAECRKRGMAWDMGMSQHLPLPLSSTVSWPACISLTLLPFTFTPFSKCPLLPDAKRVSESGRPPIRQEDERNTSVATTDFWNAVFASIIVIGMTSHLITLNCTINSIIHHMVHCSCGAKLVSCVHFYESLQQALPTPSPLAVGATSLKSSLAIHADCGFCCGLDFGDISY